MTISGLTLMPLIAAIATSAMIIACIFTPWGLVAGAPLVALALSFWYWPRGGHSDELHEEQP